MSSPAKIFCCYAHKDQALLKRLKIHLVSLQRQDIITTWTDADISPGTNWEQEITKHINTARIILLLISPDFLASDYCYSKEMTQALERDKRGDAQVIPIILRPVYWQEAPFHRLQALPKNAKPLTKWANIDDGFLSIVEGILLAVKNLPQQPSANTFPQSANNQLTQGSTPSTPQQSPINNSPVPTTISTPSQSAINRMPIQSRPSTPQQSPINTSSVPTTNQPIRGSASPIPQQPLANGFSVSTNNLTPIQQQAITYAKKTNATNLPLLAFKVFKIILYFFGCLIAEFGFLGGSLELAGTNKNLSNGLGGIAFFIGLVAILIGSIIFFRKSYYSHHLHCAQYMWLIIITTVSSLAIFVLGLSLIPGTSTEPLKSAILASILTLYGISLVVITYLKPSSNKTPLQKSN